jgi:hypothetical protein
MINRKFSECCPECGNNNYSLINREYSITTSCYRKITHTMLIETLKCDKCGVIWFNNYAFLHCRRSDWIFSFPILKCPICGGDNFEIEWQKKGTDTRQCLQFRCIENNDFLWTEEYEFSHSRVPEKEELDMIREKYIPKL